MDLSGLARRGRFRATRLKIAFRDFFRLLVTENQIRIPLFLFFGILGLRLALEQGGLGGMGVAVLKTALSIAEIGLGIIVSLEIFTSELRPHAKARIDRPEAVLDFYEDRGCANEFIQLSGFPGWQENPPVPERAPAIVESVPESPLQTESLCVDLQDRFFPLPDRVQRLYEPVLDELQEQFVDEDNFNQIKLRPLAFTGNEFRMGTTTFFNNFATNLSPDYQLFTYRTPRELLHPLVFHDDGTLRSLTETDLPYIAASAGMVIGRNGEAIFPIRSREVVIEGMNLGLSFGGSWDKDVVDSEGVHGQITRELDEERGIPEEMAVDLYYLGTLRRLELLGKPDCFLVAITDGVPLWEVASREETETIVRQLVPDDVTVDSIDTLLNHVETVNERISQLLVDSAYPPSPGLLYWVYLLNLASENRS